MEELRIAKDRLLHMYSKLAEGKTIYKNEAMEQYGCSSRSLQRDIEDLRAFLSNQRTEAGIEQELIVLPKN